MELRFRAVHLSATTLILLHKKKRDKPSLITPARVCASELKTHVQAELLQVQNCADLLTSFVCFHNISKRSFVEVLGVGLTS